MRGKKLIIKSKSDRLLEPLFTRWITGDYRHFLSDLKNYNSLPKRHPKINKLYDFRYVNLRKTKLNDTIIENACFNNAQIYDGSLSSCNFTKSEFMNVDFVKSRINETEFLECKFDESNFEGSIISETKMNNCSLVNCCFQYSKLLNVDITDSVLDGANLCAIQFPYEDILIGIPKSMKNVIIDRFTFMCLKNNYVKSLIYKQGKVIDTSPQEQYDVALSFAGENREYVEEVANYLKQQYVKVFYDHFETANLWGKELITHLTDLYYKQAKYVIIFASEYYVTKPWTNVERIATLSKILDGNYDFILPVMLDNTVIKGLTNSKGYLDGSRLSPKEVGMCFYDKLLSDLNKKKIE